MHSRWDGDLEPVSAAQSETPGPGCEFDGGKTGLSVRMVPNHSERIAFWRFLIDMLLGGHGEGCHESDFEEAARGIRWD